MKCGNCEREFVEYTNDIKHSVCGGRVCKECYDFIGVCKESPDEKLKAIDYRVNQMWIELCSMHQMCEKDEDRKCLDWLIDESNKIRNIIKGVNYAE